MLFRGQILSSHIQSLAILAYGLIFVACSRSGTSNDAEPESSPTGFATRTVVTNSRVITSTETPAEEESIAGVAPALPSFSLDNPGPSNSNIVTLSGMAGGAHTIGVYTDSGCTILSNSTTATKSGSFSLNLVVTDDSITTFYVQAADGDLTSECSPSGVTYIEDSVAPGTPTLSSSNPTPPSSIGTPVITGNGDPSTLVTLYSDSNCSASVGSGTTDVNGNYNITTTTLAVGINQIFAQSADAAGNVSACQSGYLSYEYFRIGTGLAYLNGTETIDAGNPTNMNPSTTTNLSWSTYQIDSSYYSYSTSNPDRLSIEENGDYFVSVTLPLSSALQRSNVILNVEVNGVAVDTGYSSSSYIRNTNNHVKSSDHIAILIVGLSKGDYITASVLQEALSGTVTTSQATMHVEFVASSRTVFSAKATDVLGGSNLNPTAADALSWTADRQDAGFSYSTGSPESIPLDNGGSYLVFVNVPLEGAVTRAAPILNIKVDGVTVNGGIAAQGYLRNSSDHDQASVHWSGFLSNITAGQVLTITIERGAGSGTVTVPSGYKASVFVEELTSTSGVYASRATNLSSGVDFAAASSVNILWENDDIIDTNTYTHDTNTNSHQVILNQNGDYLLVYNDALTATTQRSAAIINVNVNGVAIVGAEASTHYNRSSSGHNESSASLVFPMKSMSAGDVITVSTVAGSDINTQTLLSDPHLILVYKGGG